jgi:hypothetical protein
VRSNFTRRLSCFVPPISCERLNTNRLFVDSTKLKDLAPRKPAWPNGEHLEIWNFLEGCHRLHRHLTYASQCNDAEKCKYESDGLRLPPLEDESKWQCGFFENFGTSLISCRIENCARLQRRTHHPPQNHFRRLFENETTSTQIKQQKRRPRTP